MTFRPTTECGLTLKLVHDMTITYNELHRTGKYSQLIWIIWTVWLSDWVFVYELSGCGFESCYCHLNFRYGTWFKQELPWHLEKLWQKCRFSLKLVRGMRITHSQMHHTDKYSQHNSFIWSFWLNGLAFGYELSSCEFEYRCCHLNFRYIPSFKQGVLWHSAKL